MSINLPYIKMNILPSHSFPTILSVGAVSSDIKIDLIASLVGWNSYSTAFKRPVLKIKIFDIYKKNTRDSKTTIFQDETSYHTNSNDCLYSISDRKLYWERCWIWFATCINIILSYSEYKYFQIIKRSNINTKRICCVGTLYCYIGNQSWCGV